jgi:hypothetical protein
MTGMFIDFKLVAHEGYGFDSYHGLYREYQISVDLVLNVLNKLNKIILREPLAHVRIKPQGGII